MIASQTFNTTPGLTELNSFVLYGVNILGVKRSGLGYEQVTGTPVNQQFKWVPGRIIFDTAIPFNAGEKIWVLYQN